MAKKSKDGTEAAGRSKKRLLPIVVLLLGAGVAAKVLLGGGGSAPVAADTTTTTEMPGPVVSLEPMTVSMADGRYVRVRLALQLPHDAYDKMGKSAKGEGKGEGEAADPATTYARAIDLAVDMLGEKRFPDLVGEGAHARTRDELSAVVRTAYDGAIERVYFTEFVVE